MAGLKEQIRDLIAEIGEVDDPTRIADNADLFDDLGLDSMQAMELVLEIEDRFGVKIPETELRNIRTLADAVRVASKAT